MKSLTGVICLLVVLGLGTSISAIKAAAIKNDSALMTNAESRPKSVETIPPNAEPTISMIPQVAPPSALAENNSPRVTMLGILAELAGLKNEAETTSKILATYSSQTISSVLTRMNSKATTAEKRFVRII